jgi:hypothetical protein
MEADILGWTGQFVMQGMLSLADETKVNLFIPDRQNIYNAQRFTAPDMFGGTGTWRYVSASTGGELLTLMAQRVREMQAAATGAPAAGGRGGRGGGAGGRVATGVRGASLFQGSIPGMEAAAALLNFGRVDLLGPDGAWFGEKVTPAGKEALKAMEAAGIVLNLVRPQGTLLSDVLDNAKKPIMVTGAPTWYDAATLDKFKKNNAAVAIECDPADVDGCVSQVNAATKVVGKGAVLLSVGAGKDRAGALQKLYLALVKAGWTKAEINAMVGAGGGGGGMGTPAPNNLSRYMAAPTGGRGM